MLQTFVQHPYFQLAVAILAPISILILYLLYRRSLRVRLPRYSTVSKNLVSASRAQIPDLTFAYKGVVQSDISVTRIGFWNDGRETIRKDDLISGDPLRLELPDDINVLDVSPLEETSKGLGVEFSIGELEGRKVLFLSFDFLDLRDGFLLQLVHTGPGKASFRLIGKIAGTSGIERYRQIASARSFERSSERLSRVFGKKPRLFAMVVFSTYAGAGLVGASLVLFEHGGGSAIALASMGLPALLIAPAVFQRFPPVDLYGEKKA